MPRMELSDREAEIIRKHREETRFYRAGYAAALNEIEDLVKQLQEGALTSQGFVYHYAKMREEVNVTHTNP